MSRDRAIELSITVQEIRVDPPAMTVRVEDGMGRLVHSDITVLIDAAGQAYAQRVISDALWRAFSRAES